MKHLLRHHTFGDFAYKLLRELFSNTSDASSMVIKDASSRPVCVVDSIADEKKELKDALIRASGFCKTLLAYYADIASITAVLFSPSHSYIGAIGWNGYSALKGFVYDNGLEHSLAVRVDAHKRRRSCQGTILTPVTRLRCPARTNLLDSSNPKKLE